MDLLDLSRWKGLALSAAVVAAVAAATLGVTTLLGVTFPDDGSQAAGARPTTRGPGLAICVQAVEIEAVRSPNGDEVLQATAGDPAIEAEAKSQVEAAVAEVMKHPYWEPAGFAVAEPVVDIGCPSEPLPLLTRQELRWINGRPFGGVRPPHVEEASFYRIFLFVMPSVDHIDHLLGGLHTRIASQEFVCLDLFDGGPTCVAATRAIYVTREEIESQALSLSRLVAQGAGLTGPD